MMATLLTTLILAAGCALLVRSRSTQRYPPRPEPDEGSPPGSGASASTVQLSRTKTRNPPSGPRSLEKLRLLNGGNPLQAMAGPKEADPWLVPMLVHQLASLLEAGRSPQVVWAEAASSYVRYREAAGNAKDNSFEPDADPLLTVLRAADRSAALGHSVAPVLRSYGAGTESRKQKDNATQRRMRRTWAELAACWDVAELSGAPLSRLLSRYAGALEAELDADAARQTALAGPRATVKLLAWLPLFGLGLGLLMGVDPVGILLGTPVGLGALACGALLMTVGRIWSQRMVAAAEDIS